MGYEFGNSKVINGAIWGVVINNKHPDGKYQVQCKLPWIYSTDAGDKQDYQTGWLRVAALGAGKNRGQYYLPEVGDEVIIVPIHGSMRQMVVVGSVWNDVDTPPHGDNAPADHTDPGGNAAGLDKAASDTTDDKNNFRGLIGRSGAMLGFSEEKGKEKAIVKSAGGSAMVANDEKECITLGDKENKVYLFLDKKNKKITLECVDGDLHILAKKGEVHIEANKITTKAKTDQEHKAGGKWLQKSGGTMDMEAGGTMTEKAPKIDLNP